MMRIALRIMAVVVSLAGAAGAAGTGGSRVAVPSVKIEKGGACVAPTPEMRRDHMKMLLHQRDRTVRQGLRETRFSLKNCIACHAGAETGSVLGKDGFCSGCHAYAAVSVDCFECHSPLRQGNMASARR